MNWFLACLKKYAVFNGRAIRREYWMYILLYTIFTIVVGILDNVLGTTSPDAGFGNGIISTVYEVALLLPTLAVTVRRLHDIGKSGWWVLISLTGVGAIILLIWLIKDGQPGENKYGSNPLDAVNPAKINTFHPNLKELFNTIELRRMTL